MGHPGFSITGARARRGEMGLARIPLVRAVRASAEMYRELFVAARDLGAAVDF